MTKVGSIKWQDKIIARIRAKRLDREELSIEEWAFIEVQIKHDKEEEEQK